MSLPPAKPRIHAKALIHGFDGKRSLFGTISGNVLQKPVLAGIPQVFSGCLGQFTLKL